MLQLEAKKVVLCPIQPCALQNFFNFQDAFHFWPSVPLRITLANPPTSNYEQHIMLVYICAVSCTVYECNQKWKCTTQLH